MRFLTMGMGGVGHAGDITPEQAMELLASGKDAVLVDVRTEGEWANVGTPDLSSLGAEPVFIEWASAPAMTPNPAFAQTLASALEQRGVAHDATLLFICRSGARSSAAASSMAALGYSKSYNVEGGFEGSPGMGLPGWRRAGLPSRPPNG